MATDLALPPDDRSAVGASRPRRGELFPYWGDARNREDSSFDLATLLRILHDWRWMILGSVALGLAAAIVVTLLTQPLYRAWVTLEVNPPTVEILDEKSREAAAGPSLFDFLVTQAGLLSSRSLAERVAQDLNLASNPQFVGTEGDAATRLKIATAKVAGGLSVQAPEEGQLIRFAYVSDSPQLAAQVANGLAENFISAGLQRRFEASTYARTFLQQQIAKTRRDLERSERQMVQYAQQQGILDSDKEGEGGSDAGSLQSASMVALNSALAEATARRMQAEAAYRQAQLAANSAEVNENTQSLRQAKAVLEAEYQEKRTLMKPEHPDMLSLRSRIQELDRQIARERTQVASGRTNTLLADYRAAVAAERSLQSRVAQLKGSVLNLRGRSIQYNILRREVDTNRELYDALLQRYKEIGVAGGIGTTPVSIVDRAEVPGGPYKPNLMFNLLVGLALGLLGGIAAAIALEILNDTVKSREDVRNKLGLACLGAIPKRRGKGSVVEDLTDPTSPLSEAYSAVLAALRFSTATGAPRTLLITSSQASEGKSSSALALAQNHARRGARVLLIDADLRRPAFKAESKAKGLTKLLTNEEPIAEHITSTQHANLWLLPCGPIPPNPADLLSTPRIKQIMAEAAAQFDLVVVDGPPMLGLADASLLASACRNAMLIIESGKTRTRAAREAVDRIATAGAHIVGATLTKSLEEASHYGYRLYQYTAVADKRSQIVLISQPDEA
ncbi:polysaccharide biosynthesis tyrosine autokinase [Sphingomonas sp.]|uniref:GumC family protein n=1 Tax=Sphingomonas sp. TaxID=28214 RepID=UPI0017EE5183|nr:polysaccharide biosynthesis tyrosine autokinase [Sphingomonas sp.]MBA3512355.1 polysaccharide biosynthesis tyrosine autokinase [Sphingomonas sp.]